VPSFRSDLLFFFLFFSTGLFHLETPDSRLERINQLPPPLTRGIPGLPTVAKLCHSDFVARIDTPSINSLHTAFFNQLDFDLPQFVQFIGRTQIPGSSKAAKLYLVDRRADINFGRPNLSRWIRFRIALCIKIIVPCVVSCLAQICSRLSSVLPSVERHYIADTHPDHWHYAAGAYSVCNVFKSERVRR
jgi:hypothetical protein